MTRFYISFNIGTATPYSHPQYKHPAGPIAPRNLEHRAWSSRRCAYRTLQQHHRSHLWLRAYRRQILNCFPPQSTDLVLDECRQARADATDGEVWIRGNFHAHSIRSDGRLTPEEQVSNAKKQDLDLFFFTERNSRSGNDMFDVWAPKDKLVGHKLPRGSVIGRLLVSSA
ncbi:unnamed protein product, partial [Clonostachys rhizophaga]